MYPYLIRQWSCLLTLLCLYTCCMGVQPASVKGSVYDGETNGLLAGVSVSVMPAATWVFTDENGTFTLAGLPLGIHVLQLSLLGYEPQEIEVDVQADQPISLKIALKPTLIDLEAVTIVAASSGLQNMSDISKLDLQLRPLKSAQDALTTVPGLFIAQHAGGGKAEQLFLRGFDLDHGTDIRLSVDGQPVNMVSHAHGQGYADLHFVIPETINRIQYEKGPYDSRSGDFATAGQVDFQTQDVLASHTLKLELGQFGYSRGLAMLDLLPSQSDQHAYIATEYVGSAGYFDAPQGYQRINLLGKYVGRVGKDSYLRVSVSHFDSQWDASGQIPQRAVHQGIISRFGAIDSTEGGETSRTNVNLQLTQSLPNGGKINQHLFYNRITFALFSNFTFWLEDSVNGDQIRQREQREILGYKGSYHQQHRFGKLSVESQLGIQFRMDRVDALELSQTTNRTLLRNRLAFGDLNQQNLGVYLSQHWQLAPKLSLHTGLRYDQFRFTYQDRLTEAYDPTSFSEGIVSPNASIRYTHSPSLQLFLKAGTGFHSNDARLIVAGEGSTLLPRAKGLDVGIRVKPMQHTYLQLAAWGLWSDQEFVYVGDAAIVEAGGRSRRLGLDLSLRQQFTPWLFADVDLNYTHARGLLDQQWNAYVPLAPGLTSTGGLSVRTTWGLESSLRYRHLSDRPANEDYSLTARGYSLVDMVVRYTIGQVSLTLTVDNLLNRQWEEAQFETTSRLQSEQEAVTEIHVTPGSPRFIRTSLTYQF